MEQIGWRLFAKKALDRTVAAIGLVALSPALAAIAIAIRATMGSPVLFRQRRPGHRCAPFEVVKFRTMLEACDRDGRPLPDSERMTRLGTFLRASSLDELPQLYNVLRGEMSLVGPRPLVMRYLPRYNAQQARRHDVLSGITGWAQVNGRNAISWEERFELDVWYVDHWSLMLDARILLLTIWKVARREGVSATDHVTMTEFMGTPREDGPG